MKWFRQRLSSWMAPILARRDRWLVDPAFQRRSMRLPIARRIARKRMRALFDLCGGFVYSQVLLACVRLDLFERLRDEPRTAGDLADAVALPRDSVERLAEAAVSLDLLERRGADRFGLGPLGAALLGNPSITMMIEHHAALYEDLADPVALLRDERPSTRLGEYWAYSRKSGSSAEAPDNTAEYSRLMASSQEMIAEQVLAAYPMDAHRRLLDVGGGAGAFVVEALRHHPGLQACVFDLPAVAEQARERLDELGLSDRGDARGGSFLAGALPDGSDLISFVRVLHDHDDGAVMQALRAARKAITDDGVLLIAEPMLRTRGAEPVTAAYFGFYFLAMGQGRARSPSEIGRLVRDAGFRDVKMHRTAAPLLVRVLTARPGPPA
jgi:demethylspheroidene O-methyltransferase